MRRIQLISLFLIFSALIGIGAVTTHSVSNESQIDSKVLARISDIVKQGMDAKAFPGCQVLVMKLCTTRVSAITPTRKNNR